MANQSMATEVWATCPVAGSGIKVHRKLQAAGNAPLCRFGKTVQKGSLSILLNHDSRSRTS